MIGPGARTAANADGEPPRWNAVRHALVGPRVALTVCYASFYALFLLNPPRAPFGPAWMAVAAFGLASLMALAGLRVFRVRSRPDAPRWTALVGAAHAVVVLWAAVSVGFLFLALLANAPHGLAFLAAGTFLSLLAFVGGILHFILGGGVLFYALPFLYVAMLLALRKGTLDPRTSP